MKALIIDDHKINRLYLKTLLIENFPLFKQIDESATVSSGIELFEKNSADVVFLDMELKDGIGFDVLKVIKDFAYVIIVTNHKEYAIQAFKHNVIDYILKPIDVNEFKAAVKKVVKLYEGEIKHKNMIAEPGITTLKNEGRDTLMINYKNQYIAIDKKDILFIKALGKYSEIHVTSKCNYTSYKNLKEFETAMQDMFIRIHHSYLVNFKCIVSYSRDTSHVKLSNGDEIPVSVRKREELFKRFKLF